jgi:aspartate aminotransferase, mitochondrial
MLYYMLIACLLIQGFATGDCERDCAAIRLFVKKGLPLAVSQSFAKNLGMYGQRIGALSIVCDDNKQAMAVESQIKLIARAMYSSPPAHGAFLVHQILSDPKLKAQWCATQAMATAHVA